MKLLKSLVLIPLLLLLVNTSIYAETVYTEGALNYVIKNGTVTIIEYFGSDPEVTIPNTINNAPVTQIDDNAFVGSNAKSINIPDSVLDTSNIKFDEGVTFQIVDESNLPKQDIINEDDKEDINNNSNNDTSNQPETNSNEEIDIDETDNNEEDINITNEIIDFNSDVVETGDVDPDAIEDIEINEDSNNIVNNDNNSLFIVVIGVLIIGGIIYFVYRKKSK